MRETSPSCEALETANEGLCAHVWHDVQVNCSHNTTSVQAYPNLSELLTNKGLVKSTPVFIKGGLSSSRISGSGGGIGAQHDRPSKWRQTCQQ